MCELVKWHPSITVTPQWLNVLMMREGEMEGGGGESKEEYEGQKERKALIQES